MRRSRRATVPSVPPCRRCSEAVAKTGEMTSYGRKNSADRFSGWKVRGNPGGSFKMGCARQRRFSHKIRRGGLLACAMGMERGDRELVSLSHAIRMAVRGDRPGTRVVDFQTVQGRPHLYTAENKPRAEDKSNIVSRRWYLEDASFWFSWRRTRDRASGSYPP